MLSPNKIERELISKFIDKARRAVPQVRIRYVEKFCDSDDIYLRLSLSLPKDVDITDPADIELLQKLASAMPAHPKYHLSLTYIEALDEDHELSLQFLSPELISGKQYGRRGLLAKLIAEHLSQEYFFKRWYLALFIISGVVLTWLYMHFMAQPLEVLEITSAALRRGARYANYDATTTNLQYKARGLAASLEQALNEYADAVADEDTGFVYKDEKRRHLLLLKKLLESDPIIGSPK